RQEPLRDGVEVGLLPTGESVRAALDTGVEVERLVGLVGADRQPYRARPQDVAVQGSRCRRPLGRGSRTSFGRERDGSRGGWLSSLLSCLLCGGRGRYDVGGRLLVAVAIRADREEDDESQRDEDEHRSGDGQATGRTGVFGLGWRVVGDVVLRLGFERR